MWSSGKSKTFVIKRICNDGIHELVDGSYCPEEMLRHADYRPEVGDVVEFGGESGTQKGIIYLHSVNKLLVAGPGIWYVDVISNIRKIGHVRDMDGVRDCATADSFAKAYFLEQSEPKSYADQSRAWVKLHKVMTGSKLKVIGKWEKGEGGFTAGTPWDDLPEKAAMQGKICKVVCVTDKYVNVKLNGHVGTFPYFVLEPVK